MQLEERLEAGLGSGMVFKTFLTHTHTHLNLFFFSILGHTKVNISSSSTERAAGTQHFIRSTAVLDVNMSLSN